MVVLDMTFVYLSQENRNTENLSIVTYMHTYIEGYSLAWFSLAFWKKWWRIKTCLRAILEKIMFTFLRVIGELMSIKLFFFVLEGYRLHGIVITCFFCKHNGGGLTRRVMVRRVGGRSKGYAIGVCCTLL